MLRKFTLRNYKNFKDEIIIDFKNIAGYQFSMDCITDGIISKMLIYHLYNVVDGAILTCFLILGSWIVA